MRILALLLLFAACGSKQASPGSPQVVAKAAFEALKAGGIGPLEEHLMTPEEARRIMSVALDDSAERERWDRLLSQEHDRLGVDWATAKLGVTRVKMDAMGSNATVSLEILSDTGSAKAEIEVLKIGSRFVFQNLKALKAAPPAKEAAPAGEDDGCGG
ncbi:MAG TPA: hypothetical protein VFY93_07840 [Planctomycetota bacterium]|nr:hypothetical protein [Planctomycetota bacterium]